MQYIFEERFGIAYKLTNDKQEYISADKFFKIAYSNYPLNEGVYFPAHTILFEKDIKKIELPTGIYKKITTLFSHNKSSVLDFDVFAAVFYLISRYEEYLDTPKDAHDNYVYTNSILFKLNILDEPVVEQWLELLKEVFLKNYPALLFKNHKPKFALTFDIDVAFAFKHKGIIRTTGSFIERLITLKPREAKDQLLVLLNRKKDMFDTYSYIFESIKNKKPVFFFDMGDHGKFDKNPSYRNRYFRQLIKDISSKAVIGVHPSYASNMNKKLVAIEKNRLEEITEKTVVKSRQHYLKLQFPGTYINIINNNIKEDFTLGYSAAYGYRAGTCNSFLFFNLKTNTSTNLRLYPFAYMDVTLNNYLKLSADEAKRIVSKLIAGAAKYSGVFIPLWHNSTLCNYSEWLGWREVFEHTLKEIDNYSMENLIE